MMKNKKTIFIIILSILFSCSLINSIFFKNVSSPAEKNAKITVNTYTVKQTEIKKTIELTGTAFPKEEIKISPRIEGNIIAIFKDSGDFVKKGDVLAKIEDTDYKIKLLSAKASLSEAIGSEDIARANVCIAKSNFKKSIIDKKRYTKLFKEGCISARELDQIITTYEVNYSKLKNAQQDYIYITKAKIEEAQALLDARQKEFDDCTIKAPVNGYIIQKNIKTGFRTSKNKAAYIIARDNEYEYIGDIAESDIFDLKKGQQALITSTVNKNIKFNGKIRKIEPYINPQTRIGKIKITLPNNKNIHYGMFLDALITIENKKNLTIPKESLVFRNNKNMVFVKDDKNIVHKREVKIGIKNQNNIEVINGLKEGESIITDGVGFLYDGDKVNIPRQ